MTRRLPSLTAARAWLEQRHQAPALGYDTHELAALLRAADQELLAVARMHDQAAERARVQAQQARDLLAGLVRETGVSP
jgi:uncharacterized membrane protein